MVIRLAKRRIKNRGHKRRLWIKQKETGSKNMTGLPKGIKIRMQNGREHNKGNKENERKYKKKKKIHSSDFKLCLGK